MRSRLLSINHFAGSIDAENAKLVIHQKDAVLNGIEADLELALCPLNGFEELGIFDRHPKLIANGSEELAAFRPDLEMAFVGHIQKPQHFVLIFERDADNFVDPGSMHSFAQLGKKKSADRDPVDHFVIAKAAHHFRSHGNSLDSVHQAGSETVMSSQFQQPLIISDIFDQIDRPHLQSESAQNRYQRSLQDVFQTG